MGWAMIIFQILSAVIELLKFFKSRKDLTKEQKAELSKQFKEAMSALRKDKNPKPLEEFHSRLKLLCPDGVCNFEAETVSELPTETLGS